MFAAELTHEPRQREIWTRLAVMWASAAVRCRHEDAGAISWSLPTSAATRLEPPQGRAVRKSPPTIPRQNGPDLSIWGVTRGLR